MTERMSQAVAAIANLQDKEQDEIAELVLAELAWQQALARNPEKLQKLEDEALAEIRAVRTEALDLDRL